MGATEPVGLYVTLGIIPEIPLPVFLLQLILLPELNKLVGSDLIVAGLIISLAKTFKFKFSVIAFPLAAPLFIFLLDNFSVRVSLTFDLASLATSGVVF